MLTFIKKILVVGISFINHLLLVNKPIKSKSSQILLSKVSASVNNFINLDSSFLKRSKIVISGESNKIDLSQSEVNNSRIFITGNNNAIVMEKGVVLRNGIIHIRGNNCTIKIGSNTTFGQIRIVNVGKNNSISIGKNCLFADNIEIWASDTHSIYDSKGNFINPEKPIEICDKVWIGSYVKILKGVKIEEGAIIGMNSVVTKNIPPSTLNAGNPLKCLKSNVSWSLDYENEKL